MTAIGEELRDFGPVDWSLLPTDAKVLAAVSGGADSMALLLVLHQARLPVYCAHVNHGLRAEESDGDEEFVRRHCETVGVPFVCRRLDLGTTEKVSEAVAREARYAALAAMARECGCESVATGHTATDLLETVLINWLRGAAITGMRGMVAQRELAPGLRLVRPLLNLTRDQTRAMCTKAGWDWREDSTNQQPLYLRNRIRQELLPRLNDLLAGQGGVERLARQTARSARVFQDDLDFLQQAAAKSLQDVLIFEEQSQLVLNGLRFGCLALAMQRRVLRLAVEKVQGGDQQLEYEHLEEARRHIVENGRRRVWQWPGGVNLEWTGSQAGNRIRLWLVT